MTERKFRIGLDIGIGSVGWAVISHENKQNARIEDFGSRIFSSGERSDGKERLSQERRGFRSVRRLVRRRHWRKERLKNYLLHIGLLSRPELEEAIAFPEQDILTTKVKALTDDIGNKKLLQVLLHTCNHRGYRDFYDYDEDSSAEDGESAEEEKEAQEAVQKLDAAFQASKCRTISEYILQDFSQDGKYPSFRNHPHKKERLIINRRHLREETKLILHTQKNFHKELNDNSCHIIMDIIFQQRCFEDGPGNKTDEHRRYTGFLDKLGKCPFYPTEKRGFRNTVLADIYAVVNALSQYRYVSPNHTSGLPASAASELIRTTLEEAVLTISRVKSILKKYNIQVFKSPDLKDTALSNAIRFLRPVKRIADATGMDWMELLGSDPLSWEHPPLLHEIGETLAKYKTPHYRNVELKKLIKNEEFLQQLSRIPFSGASAVSYHYMHDAIESFMEGCLYGDFQWSKLANQESLGQKSAEQRQRTLSPDILLEDEDVKNNPVVFRAINETRKIVNAIVRVYGAPECINIEVGRELGRSFIERKRLDKQNDANKKMKEQAKKKISDILKCPTDEVRDIQIERYRLYEEQEGKCLYSGEPIDLEQALKLQGAYEVDHIVPYSLILDNTLQNKALVKASENQHKRQRLPLMYLEGKQKAAFLERVNAMRERKATPISRKKYAYLTMETLYGKEAEGILRDWKSRNINDMRYITKYVANYFKKHLCFSDGEVHVYAIRGAITTRFRRIWLKGSPWGEVEKDRTTYLNHAIDAVVIANLSPAYVEIASDNMRLQQILRSHKRVETDEYREYMENAVKKMQKYYGFSPDYTRSLLCHKERVPSLIQNLRDEVDIRFNDHDEALFKTQVESFYGSNADFIYPPHIPLTSHKPERRFRGAVADSNPIKVRDIGGKPHKIFRTDIAKLSKRDLDKLYTNDTQMKDFLAKIFEDKHDKYTVGEYLSELNLSVFHLPNGRAIHKISKDAGAVSNFYKKTMQGNNYSMLGMAKYYCVGFYKNKKGELCSYGIRYVDVVKQNKKLYLKEGVLPSDYREHVAYLFAGDYIEVLDKNENTVMRGFYQSVKAISRNQFYLKPENQEGGEVITIGKKCKIVRREMDILGHVGGVIRCGEPLLCIMENES